MSATFLRNLPSVDQLLRDERLQSLIAAAGRAAVRDRLREVLDEIRRELARADGSANSFGDAASLPDEIEKRLQARLARRRQSQTQHVINATGVVLHTNL